MRRFCSFVAWLVVLPSVIFGQGPIVPTGTPAPTMKTLDQVEARIPLAATPGVTITTDGSYYLTGNIAALGFFAIGISANNVTLDLNGYAITATNATGVASPAIFFTGTGHFTVRNGSIRGQTTYDAGSKTFNSLGFGYGIQVQNATAVRIEHVEISGVAKAGIQVSSTGTTDVSHCQVNVSAGTGIAIAGPAATVDHCVALNVAGDGIQGGTVTACYATVVSGSNGILAQTVADSFASSEAGYGIQCKTAANCKGTCGALNAGITASSVVTNCTGEAAAGGDGIRTVSAVGCYGISTSGIGITGGVGSNCTGESTSNTGVFFYSTASNCTGYSSTGSGLVTTLATNCIGTTNGTAATNFGLDCGTTGVATGCRGVAPTGNTTPTALRAFIGNSCVTSGGKVTITNKYNMP